MIKVSIEPPKERIVTIQMTQVEASALRFALESSNTFNPIVGICGILGAFITKLKEENL
jgi:hypothetical protein